LLPTLPRSYVQKEEENMSLIWTLIIGLVVGLIAKALMPGRDPGGFIVTALIGIAGAFIASLVGRSMNWYAEGQPAGFIASVVGAIALLAVYRMVTGRRTNAAARRA
jgi:uncharacterized membrane protein YeaQ/YmgE (transglycosylase-associated protein family)